MTRVVHGTPITPKRLLEPLRGGSFCVSFARPDQVEECIDLVGPTGILVLDNGAFTHWKSGKGAIDREAFWTWANRIQDRCPQAVAVIPDVIEGSEHENLLEMSWALREGLADYPERCMSIWHMNDSQDFLATQLKLCNFVGIGSCAEFDVQRNKPGYLDVMKRVYLSRRAIKAAYGRSPWIHLMRGLAAYPEVAWAESADSSNVARNHCRYRDSHGDDRTRFMATRIHAQVQVRASRIPVDPDPASNWGVV